MLNGFTENKPGYYLNDNGEFVVDNYNSAKPFSSFLPGIAGITGIPMWVFYVNRGQCICSMGIQDKDHAIMEFYPANMAYERVAIHGFRTLLRFLNHPVVDYYEPFMTHYRDRAHKLTQRMRISASHLVLEEENHTLNLRFTVHYFTIPQDEYAGVVRTLHIHNTGAKEVSIEGLDGLPVIVPYGVDNFCLKNMRRTIEAFVEVCNLHNKAPFFRAKVEAADRPDVAGIAGGNFYIGFEVNGSKARCVSPVVDPTRIFGTQTDLSIPRRFLEQPLQTIVENQVLESQLPCAMGPISMTIHPGEEYTYCSVIGHAATLDDLGRLSPRIASPHYVQSKARTNHELMEVLTQNNLTCSREATLDSYARQNYLDNIMRGGTPITLEHKKNQSTLYLYSRKHGDLERDYNDFRLTPTYYSQGNGNFRDINQNRRSDLFFNPDIKEANIEYFYNLIQLDGFNPLVLKEVQFAVGDRKKARRVLKRHIAAEHNPEIESLLEQPFTPGELLAKLRTQTTDLPEDITTFVAELLEHCRLIPGTDHGEGFWIDHWTYNLDLIENYLAVYPDRFREVLFDTSRFTYHNSPYRLLPRDKRYVLRDDRVRQLHGVIFDEEKALLISERDDHSNMVRSDFGTGSVYRTSLFAKLLCLIVNKLASLDPEGVGVEMEAGKPGWYDALNGLPALLGSSICETIELKRHILFLSEQLRDADSRPDRIAVFTELAQFIEAIDYLLNNSPSSMTYWDGTTTAKESFREQTRLGISGQETNLSTSNIMTFLESALGKVNAGIKKAWDSQSKTIVTYFRYDVVDYEVLESVRSQPQKHARADDAGITYVMPRKLKQIRLPLFLEGNVHYLRCRPGKSNARALAVAVKGSELYDDSLRMYKVNASLADQPLSIGRARVFTPGWLENESIWLHMEYKYLLELLRNQLYDEFYDDFRKTCIPFLNPDRYGRSTLENSSFIASSAHSDPTIHGNGFVARLTGATAEFIHMLSLMALGPNPFRLSNEGQLQFHPEPALPAWLFTLETRSITVYEQEVKRQVELPPNTFSFMFLGNVLLVYHNSEMKDSFGKDKVKPVKWRLTDRDGTEIDFEGAAIAGEMAACVRQRKFQRIDIHLI